MWTIIAQLIVWWLETVPFFMASVEHTLISSAAYIYHLYSQQWIIKGNKLIHLKSQHFIVVNSLCTGLSLSATLLAGIFSLSIPWQKKIIMALLSILLIQLENSFRIAHLFYQVNQTPQIFNFFHLYVWQLINFVSALLIFLGLYSMFAKEDSHADHANS